MAWLRIDDRVRTHPKIVQAGPAAAWLWFCGICYCREHLTDGFIPALILPTLVPGMSQVKRPIAALLAAGLWHEREGGYEVHDFLDWNPTRAEIVQRQRYEKDKKRRQRGSVPEGQDGDIDEGQVGDSCTGARDHAGDAGSAGLGSILASDWDRGFPEESARETRQLPARRGARGGALMAGGSYLTHQKHGACNDRGLCVPQFLHDEFIGKANGDAAHVAAFYAAELASLPPDAMPGDDPIAFWRNAWRRRHGSTQQKPGLVDKLRASDDAAKAMLIARGHR